MDVVSENEGEGENECASDNAHVHESANKVENESTTRNQLLVHQRYQRKTKQAKTPDSHLLYV